MKVLVSGTNMEVGQSLIKHVEENIEKDVKKYFENAIDAQVHFSKEGSSLVKTTITVDEGVRGSITVKSDATAGDAYGSFNEALTKAVKQLRRYKRRLVSFRKKLTGIKSEEPATYSVDATKYIIPQYVDESQDSELEDDITEEVQPHIITQKAADIETLSINEAIMKMDLSNLPALVFIDRKTKNINVVYHRKDGNISWIDTAKVK